MNSKDNISAENFSSDVVKSIKELDGFEERKNTNEEEIVEVHLMKEIAVDTSEIYKVKSLKEGTPLTWAAQIGDTKDFYDRYKIDLSDCGIDKDLANYVVSVGRRITDIRYSEDKKTPHGDYYYAEITFAEDYADSMLYLYSTEKINFYHFQISTASVYKMNGNNRELWGEGLRSINTSIDELTGGL